MGLGFLTLVNLATGAKALGFNDAYMRFLENHGASPSDYPSMTDAQRVAASIATGNLHWTGANVRALSGNLTAGTVGDHVRMFAPNPQQPGSSVSHWDTVLTPNQLMEPAINVGLPHNAILEDALFRDLGWTTPRSSHDFSGEARSDIAWRQTGGATALWLMNGAAFTPAGIGTIATNWQLVGQRDFNGDGRHDLLWRDNASWRDGDLVPQRRDGVFDGQSSLPCRQSGPLPEPGTSTATAGAICSGATPPGTPRSGC